MNLRDALIAEKQESSRDTTDKISKNKPTGFNLVGFLNLSGIIRLHYQFERREPYDKEM